MPKSLRLLTAVVAMATNTWTAAATMAWTGAGLVGDPSVAFPTQAPTTVGTSIQFTGSANFEKRIEIPLLPAGFFSVDSPTGVISFQLNITRLSGDWDPHFVLSDGANLVGVAISDDNGANQIQYVDKGTYGYRLQVDDNIFQSLNLEIDRAADLLIDFLLGPAGTTISVGRQGVTGSYTSTRLDRTQALSFVFMTDNEPPERYQINSLAISTPQAVPLPATWLLISAGLAGLLAAGSRGYHR